MKDVKMKSSTTTLIQNGSAVLENTVSPSDILIRGEKIAAIGNLGDTVVDRRVDASGLLIFPGAVDGHIHFKRMAIYSDYFNRKDEQQPDPGLKSPPSTRPLSALPVVTAIRHQGLTGLKQRLRKPLETVNACIKYIRAQQDLELMLTPDLGIFCVRLVPPGFPEAKLNALQKYLYDQVINERERSVSMTHVNGKCALRFLILTPEQDVNEIINTFDYLRRLARQFED